MSEVESPPWHAEDWDSGSFDQTLCSGLMHVEIDRGPKWDRKAVKGQTGETQTFNGWNNANVKIRVRTWTATQHADFLANILPLIEPTPGKEAPKQLAFDHATARARAVDIILIDKIKGPTVDDEGRFSEWEIDAFQSIKKQPQKGGPAGAPGQTPCQQAKAQYDFLVGELSTAGSQYAEIHAAYVNGRGVDDATLQSATDNLQAAKDRVQNQANLLEENGCNKEQSPSSQQQTEGSPPP